jgi:hypothetical protein
LIGSRLQELFEPVRHPKSKISLILLNEIGGILNSTVIVSPNEISVSEGVCTNSKTEFEIFSSLEEKIE